MTTRILMSAIALSLLMGCGEIETDVADLQAQVADLQAALDAQIAAQADTNSGLQGEIDAINGGVAAIGEQAGIPCPLNRAIADMVKALEFSWTLEA